MTILLFTHRHNSDIDDLYQELKDTYPQAYVSLILGMAKYQNMDGASAVYAEALKNKIKCM